MREHSRTRSHILLSTLHPASIAKRALARTELNIIAEMNETTKKQAAKER